MIREPKITPYLDMPPQHISDTVLKRMKRDTNGDAIRRRLHEVRHKIPNIALRTTMLVGYPGEADVDFRSLIDFVEEMRFERLGAFAYSREEGTASYDLDLQGEDSVKAERFDELMYRQRQISKAHNNDLVGQAVYVLIEKQSPESELVWVRRTAQQAPEIDGVTYLGASEAITPGRIIKARVTQATDYDQVVEPLSGLSPA